MTASAPAPRLEELSELLVGDWRVEGPDIEGRAEYRSVDGGRLLVLFVDFRVGGTRMRVLQHISHHEASGTLRASNMDTMGDRSTYTWELYGRTIRVSLGEQPSDTYFRATLDEDRSRYVGTWHYPDSEPQDPVEGIVYTRVTDDE